MMHGNAPALPVATGAVVDGKYRIDEQLGAGGMGTVMAATHLVLDQRVAIKFLSPEVSASAEGMARFHREAQVSVRIKSEFVARTTDVGRLPNGTPYIVMEYLDGQDVTARLHATGPLPIEQAVEFVLQASEAVADAHALGIVHRDLKPSNLFIVRRSDGSEAIKVLDFGISKVLPGADTKGAAGSMTRTSALMGSPVYMSPEQMASARNVDGRTDIWSLGATLFEMLTGKPPFEADSLPELCSKVLTQSAPSPRERRPDVPPGLERAILHALEKDPTQRYASIAGFSTALAPFAPDRARPTAERISRILMAAGLFESAAVPSGEPTPEGTRDASASQPPLEATRDGSSSRPPPPEPNAALARSASAGTMASWSQTTRRPADRRWAFAILGTAVVGLVGAGVWWIGSNQPPATKPAQADSATSAEPAASTAPAEQAVTDAATAASAASATADPAASIAPSVQVAPDEMPNPKPAALQPPTTARPSTPSKPPANDLPTTRHADPPPRPGQLPSDRVGSTGSRPSPKSGDNLMLDRK